MWSSNLFCIPSNFDHTKVQKGSKIFIHKDSMKLNQLRPEINLKWFLTGNDHSHPSNTDKLDICDTTSILY